MAYGIRGNLRYSYEPYSSNTSFTRDRQYSWSSNRLQSANDPLVFTINWYGALNESEVPTKDNFDVATEEGDIVSILFDVYKAIDSDLVFPSQWKKIATVRKTRDMPNISERDIPYGGGGNTTQTGQRFTMDIGEICKGLVNYSLVPIGKGTWTSWNLGGLNGGPIRQDNVALPVWSNSWIQSPNGTFANVRVRARAEILDQYGLVQEASLGTSIIDSYQSIMLINNVMEYDTTRFDNNSYTQVFGHSSWGASASYPRIMQSWSPNYTYYESTDNGRHRLKDVRLEEAGEYLQWVQAEMFNNNESGTAELVDDTYLKVEAYNSSWVLQRTGRLYDWNAQLKAKTTVDGEADVYPRQQYRVCMQNISPVFINTSVIYDSSAVKDTWQNSGTTYTRYTIDTGGGARTPASLFINDDIAFYKISLVAITKTGSVVKSDMAEHRWYRIDRDRQLPDSSADISNGARYGGVYYTALRTDATTIGVGVQNKGFLWNSTGNPFVRFHWLNNAGGIDSYTVKGPKTESYLNSKEIIQRNEGNRYNFGVGESSGSNPDPYTGTYLSDTLRGLDNHKGGREVMSVNSDRRGTVVTLPLNKTKAKWLREITTSPNVWIETLQQQAAQTAPLFYKLMNRSISTDELGASTDGRTPTNIVYTPVIVTSEEVDVVNEAQGLVTMTFDYTYAHAVKTQRN